MSGRRSGKRFASRQLHVARRAVVAFVGGVLVVAAGCSAPSVPPTMDEVLDGPATAQARSAAFKSVDRWANGLVVPGLSEVARNHALGCREGHNDWKTNDGYRLKCGAHTLVYLGWDDSFDAGASSVLASLRRLCALSAED